MKEQHSSQKPLLFVAGGIFLLAASIGGTYLWLQSRATHHAHIVGLQRDMATVARMNQAAKGTSEQRQRKIAQAQMLRAKWQVWAQQHQGILRQMLQAQPNDQTARNVVWNALPPLGDQSVISAKDLLPDGQSPTGLSFGWAPVDRIMASPGFNQSSDVEERRRTQEAVVQMAAARQNDFETLHDIMLASSSGQGNTNVTLWVSGRITQETPQTQEERMAAIQKIRASGEPPHINDLQGTRSELVPPFDFLK